MRTVIFLGLLAIAEAINPALFIRHMESGRAKVMVIILGCTMAMDIGEFIMNLGKDRK